MACCKKYKPCIFREKSYLIFNNLQRVKNMPFSAAISGSFYKCITQKQVSEANTYCFGNLFISIIKL